jgi:hypothetical protein
MRAASYLAFAMFSISTVAVPSTAPNATDRTASWASVTHHRAIIDAARGIASDLAARQPVRLRVLSAMSQDSRGTSIGETLPDAIELHPIPKHETYRYAVVNDHRVIVDAASRKVVYVVQ